MFFLVSTGIVGKEVTPCLRYQYLVSGARFVDQRRQASVVVRRKVSMIVLLLLGLVAVRIVGDVREAVRDGAFIYEQHKTRAR